MKTRFAKFVDRTVGAALLFLVLTAVLKHYTTTELAAFSAVPITICLFFMLGVVGKRKDGEARNAKRTDDMFYDFMFESESYPAKKLAAGLKNKNIDAVVRADAVYVGKTAAFFAFGKPPDDATIARMIARATRMGASSAVLFCKSPPTSTVDVKDFKLKTVCGDDVYALFASLNALPERKFEKPIRRRFAAFANALSSDKLVRYFMLSASLFAVSLMFGFSLIPFVCAVISASLFIAAATFNIVKKVRAKRT